MINRRHIRVKVMQSAYAMHRSNSSDIDKELKFLKHSVQKMFDLYALNLLLIVEVQDLARKRIELSKKKILATTQDLKPNTKFIDNRLIAVIKDSVSLEGFAELNKLNNWSLDDEYVRIVWEELEESDLLNIFS